MKRDQNLLLLENSFCLMLMLENIIIKLIKSKIKINNKFTIQYLIIRELLVFFSRYFHKSNESFH